LKKFTAKTFFAGFCILFLLCIDVYSQNTRVETGDIEFKFKQTESFSDAALLDILLLPREKYFNRINLEEDLQRLNKFYFDNGFFDVAIDTSTQLNKEDSEVNVTFIIIENPRYLVKDFRLQGLDKVSDGVKNAINSNRLVVPGAPYNRNNINLEKDRILNILQDNGYFFAQIDTVRSKIDSSRRGIIIGKYSEEMQKDPQYKDQVIVRMRFIGTQDVYRFGKISFNIEKNNYDINQSVVAREIAFKEGDIFSKSKLIESERNFTKLAIISLGRVIPDSVNTETRIIDTKVNIELNNKYELTPGIYTSYRANRLFLGANLEYKDKYFLGGGRTLSVVTEGLYNSRYINTVSLEFTLFQPFLFNRNITATLTPAIALVNFNEDLQAILSTNLLRLSYYISDHTFYSNAFSDLTFDYVKLRLNVLDTVTGIKKFENLYVVNSIIGLTLVHNNTNNLFNPSSGFYHSVTGESAGNIPRLLSAFNKSLNYAQYFKLNTINSFYFDISGGRAASIVATNFELGDIIEYGSGENISEVPVLYKYFMGGGNSLRGWRAQTGGILADPEEGGKFILEGSLEWRRKPFPDRSFFAPVWGVLFLDYGNVWESDGKFRLDQIALASGFGIRYDTFVGPIRIDLGFKLYDPSAAEGNKWLWNEPSNIFKNKFAIHFGLGNAF